MDNKNPQIDKWKKLAKRFGLTWLFATAGLIIMLITGVPLEGYAGNGLLVVGTIAILGFLFSKLALFLAKLTDIPVKKR